MVEARLLLHLYAWAQLGILTRIYLGKLFGGACETLGLCVTSHGLDRHGGALFIDLPANVAGCFVIGLLSSADVLASAFHTTDVKGLSIAILPSRSSLQNHTPLQVGLRTGYCGSLTTYASWLLQMVRMMVAGQPSSVGTEWVAALCGLFIGAVTSLASLALGQHAALAICMALTRSGQESQEPPESQVPTESGTLRTEAAEDVHVGLGKLSSDHDAKTLELHGSQGLALHGVHANLQHMGVVPMYQVEPPSHGAHKVTPANKWQQLRSHAACYLADGLALAILLTLTSISIAYAIIDDEHGHATNRRYIWFAILFGPVGCLLRWQLARLNNQLPGSWSWFPLGTFLANQLACLLDFVMEVLTVRLAGMDGLDRSIVSAVVTGVGGCLSTVSTWVVEVQKLHMGMPLHYQGHVYTLASLLLSVTLGLVVYGTAIWTM